MKLPAALACLLASGPCWAQSSPNCVTKKSEPATLDKLLECQRAKRLELDRGYRKAHGQPPPPSLVKELAAIQKAEAKAYRKRHTEPDDFGDSTAGVNRGGAGKSAEAKALSKSQQDGFSQDMVEYINSVGRQDVKKNPKTPAFDSESDAKFNADSDKLKLPKTDGE